MQNQTHQTRGLVEMSLAMGIAGTIGFFVVISNRSAVELVFWRCLFGALVLVTTCLLKGSLRWLQPREWALATLGGVAIVVNWLLLFGALTRATISVATAVYYVQPFILLVFGATFLGERLTLGRLACLALAFAGLLLVVQLKFDVDARHPAYWTGVAMAFGAALCWAIAAIATKRLASTPPHLIALVQVCIGMVALAPFVDMADLPTSSSSWAILATIGVIHTGLVYILMYDAIHRLPTHLQGAISYLYPVVAVASDVFIFHSRLEVSQLVGVVTILIAAALMTGVLRFGPVIPFKQVDEPVLPRAMFSGSAPVADPKDAQS